MEDWEQALQGNPGTPTPTPTSTPLDAPTSTNDRVVKFDPATDTSCVVGSAGCGASRASTPLTPEAKPANPITPEAKPAVPQTTRPLPSGKLLMCCLQLQVDGLV